MNRNFLLSLSLLLRKVPSPALASFENWIAAAAYMKKKPKRPYNRAFRLLRTFLEPHLLRTVLLGSILPRTCCSVYCAPVISSVFWIRQKKQIFSRLEIGKPLRCEMSSSHTLSGWPPLAVCLSFSASGRLPLR